MRFMVPPGEDSLLSSLPKPQTADNSQAKDNQPQACFLLKVICMTARAFESLHLAVKAWPSKSGSLLFASCLLGKLPWANVKSGNKGDSDMLQGISWLSSWFGKASSQTLPTQSLVNGRIPGRWRCSLDLSQTQHSCSLS